MQLIYPTMAMLPTVYSDLLGIILTVVISFVLITLIASYYRFQQIVQQVEKEDPESMGGTPLDILRLQLARYLAVCARKSSSFSLALIRVNNPEIQIKMDSSLVSAIKNSVRYDDAVNLFDDQTVTLLMISEPTDAEAILTRVLADIAKACPEIQKKQLQVGISSYPGHGLAGKDLLDVALKALEQTTVESPVFLPEIVDYDEEDDEDDLPEEEDEGSVVSQKRKELRKNSIIDPLTGVLKSKSISIYMQRRLSEIRHKKERATLFCIGVNNMAHLQRIHGEETVDDVLAGISTILQESVRADDLIGRHEKYGFIILLQANLEDAELIGKRINHQIQSTPIVSGRKKIKASVTIGVSSFPNHGKNLHFLYEAAQKVLNYNRENDIRAYAIYDPQLHDKTKVKPMTSIKSMHA